MYTYLDYPVGLLVFTLFDPVCVEIVLIYFNHVGTSCWTVIVLRTTGCVLYYHDYLGRPLYILPALRGPAVFIPHIIWFCHLTAGL